MFYVKKLHEMKLYTLADFFSNRFGKKWIGAISAAIMFVAYIFAVTAQVIAGSMLLTTVFGWDYTVSVLVSAGIVTRNTVLGGLWTVSLTDFIQLTTTFIGVLIALGLAVSYAGPSSIAAKMGQLGLTDPRVFLAIDFWALFIVLALGDIPAPDLMQRVLASRDSRIAASSALLAGFSYIAIGIVSAVVGTAATILIPNLSNPQQAYPALISTVLPAGAAGLVLSGLMAAVMSNADSMLLAPATVVAKNIFVDLFKPNASDRELLLVSRIAVLAIGIAATLAALPKPDIIYWLVLAFDVLFASLFVPLTLGLYWRGITWQGAAASIIGGALTRLILEYLLNIGAIQQWWIASLGAPLVSFVLAVGVSLATRGSSA